MKNKIVFSKKRFAKNADQSATTLHRDFSTASAMAIAIVCASNKTKPKEDIAIRLHAFALSAAAKFAEQKGLRF